VEAHIVIAVAAVDKTADEMLAGMLLHEIKTALPVDHAVNRLTHGQRTFAAVQHFAVLFAYVDDFHPVQMAKIAGLTAAFRIKGGLIQHHVPKAFGLLAAQDNGIEFPQIGFLIIKLIQHMNSSFLGDIWCA